MNKTNSESEFISVQGVINWIFLLLVFSIITSIGNYLGYNHPISESLIGMTILSLMALSGMAMEKYLPFKIPSLIYILIIGITFALPLIPTSDIVIHYVSEIEIISLVTVFLAYVGIGLGNSWNEIRTLDLKTIGMTLLIVFSLYIVSGMILHII